jgi:hypothetical protein
MRTILRNIIKQRWLNYDVKPLGRWQVDYCDKKISRKLDLSNEDHCGPCGQYLISNSLKTDPDEEKTNYYCFFIDIDQHRKI